MYAKVFRTLWDGSLRGDSDAQIVFIYLLAHCDEEGVVEVIRAKIADDLGWRADGHADDVRLARALDTLAGPDVASRNPTLQGRRIELIDEHRNWGWRIVNYSHYREIRNRFDRRRQNREAQQRRRQHAKLTDADAMLTSAKSAHADADADAVEDLVRSAPSAARASRSLRGSRSSPEEEPQNFGDFYDAYPRHVARRAAARAFRGALKRWAKTGLEGSDLVAAAMTFAIDCEGKELQFVPHPATWLNQDRFLEIIKPEEGA